MRKLVEHFDTSIFRSDWKTHYIRFRLGRLKHQLWLWNRKRKDKFVIDEYDKFILENCQPGVTMFYGCAGYYLKDLFPEIVAVEQFPIVSTFRPDTPVATERDKIFDVAKVKADNFAVVNNRADHWVTLDGLGKHLLDYTKAMNSGCRVFYSFRDTQIHYNRLTTKFSDAVLQWASSLKETHKLTLVHSNIQFRSDSGMHENPDTTNGNIKLIFVYDGKPWTIQQ